jgi:hypothetical protein
VSRVVLGAHSGTLAQVRVPLPVVATSTTSTVSAVVGWPACAAFPSAAPRLSGTRSVHFDWPYRPGPTTDRQLLGRLEVGLQEQVHAPGAMLLEVNTLRRTAGSTLYRKRAAAYRPEPHVESAAPSLNEPPSSVAYVNLHDGDDAGTQESFLNTVPGEHPRARRATQR